MIRVTGSAALLAVLVAAAPAPGQFGPPPEVPVVVVRVGERPVRDEVSFIGSVEPDRAVMVQAEVAAGSPARTRARARPSPPARPCSRSSTARPTSWGSRKRARRR